MTDRSDDPTPETSSPNFFVLLRELGDLRYAGIQFVPTRLVTTRNGLLVTLEPQR